MKEASQQRPTFKPYQIVVAVMKEDLGASARKVRNQAKSTFEEEETVARLSHSTSLVRQNQPLNDDSRAPLLWSSNVTTFHSVHKVPLAIVYIHVCLQKVLQCYL